MANNPQNFNGNILNVAQVNINSLVSAKKRSEFQHFLNKYKPHIVLISETHLNNKHKVIFDGYKMYRSDRIICGGGGTAICIVESIDCEFVQQPKEIKSIESCSVKINCENSQIIFSAIYRRPTNKIHCEDLSYLLKTSNSANHMIAGDFNAQSPMWGSNKTCTNGRLINEWLEEKKMNSKCTSNFPTIQLAM